ncbi:MAG: hypothetical protein ACI9MC_000006 [Kiritimatiellia bacterium]
MKIVALATMCCALAAPAFAGEAEAESCLRTKVWEGYSDGWAIRTMTTATMEFGATRNYLVTFYPNKEYQVQLCGDDASKDLDVIIYDLDGKVVKRDESKDKQPMLTFKSTKIATYYVVVHAKQLMNPSSSAGVAMAITYR